MNRSVARELAFKLLYQIETMFSIWHKNSSVIFCFTLLSLHLKNEVIFKTLCYFLLILLKNMAVSIGCNCNIAMAQMLGDRLDINAVIYHKTCIAMTEAVYTDNRHIIICENLFEFLVHIRPIIVITNYRSKYNVRMCPIIAHNLF